MQFGNGIYIKRLVDEVGELTGANLRAKLSNGFLVLHGLDLDRLQYDATRTTDTSTTTLGKAKIEAGPAALIFPIVSSTGADKITVGRASDSDVRLPHQSISRIHAWFVKDGPNFLLQDAGSSNGTTLEDDPVPAPTLGDPIRLMNMAAIDFGDLAVTFVYANGLVKLMSTLSNFR